MARSPKRTVFRVAPLLVVLALVAAACDSRTQPQLRDVPWVNIPIGRINGSSTGAIGIDGQMGEYHPCNDNRAPGDSWEQDAFYGACVMPSQGGVPLYNSYTYFFRWSGSQPNWPSGLFLGNTGTCNDSTGTFCSPKGSTIDHGWSKKWSEFALEIYPDDKAAAGVRLQVACCPNEANGGAYTPMVGDIDLPRSGNPGTSPLQANVAGVSAANQVGFDAFQVDDNPSSRSSGGVGLWSFSSGANGAPGANINQWRVPALYNGTYAVYIGDRSNPNRKVVARISLPATTTITVDRTKPCFGIANPYDPNQWYLNVQLTPSQCQALWG